jgi:small subunit ribosomal protein S2
MFVTERWLGGTLTNFATVKTSIKRLKEIEKMDADGSINDYVKQEQAVIRREGARLNKYFDGLRDLDKMPAAMFVVDTKREHNAVAEAKTLGIPVVAFVDTNSDPDDAEYPIAANDDAIRSIRLILGAISQSITQGRAEFESKKSRRVNEDAPAAEAAAPSAA